jgi:type I restriction enzyme M protein
MTSIAQQQELRAKIWKIANDVRGSVDGWDFKQFVLGTLFYRFISENFTNYIEGGEEGIEYAKLSDDVITPEIKDDAIKTKGYFIYPSQLFVNVAKKANTNPNLNTDLKAIYDAIESSANGYPSEPDIKGLFADFDTTSTRLGNTVESKNNTLAKVLKGIEELDFGNFENNEIDLFGDAYEFLISNYAANAGKSGGEFFTPQHVSKLIAQLAMHKQEKVNKIYDPAAGSGSLLLQAKKHFDNHIIEEGFYGQEVNHTTYNLARMNMFLHNINYDKFNIALGNTLIDPHYGDEKPFDAIVSNPPYSIKWIGDDDPTLINDDRFAPAGVLAPKSKADFAFVLHALSYLSSKGRAAIVCFPGIFARGGAEQKIRKYLVDNNYIESIISLPPNLFYGTSISVYILVLSKHKTENKIQFIDASGEDFFKKVTNNNLLEERHIKLIMEMFDNKEDIEHVAKSIDNSAIAENGYILSVSSYVESPKSIEKIDIGKTNEVLADVIKNINSLRSEIEIAVKKIDELFVSDTLFKNVDIEWKVLGDICDFKNGFAFKSNLFKENGLPIIRITNIDGRKVDLTDVKYFDPNDYAENTKSYEVISGDVLIAMSGATTGKIGIYSHKTSAYLNQRVGKFIPKKNILNNRYLYHNLLLRVAEIYIIAGGGAQPNLSSNALMAKIQIPIPYPENPVKSMEAQAAIVNILDSFTVLTTDLNANLNAELNARKQQYEYYREVLLPFPKNNIES